MDILSSASSLAGILLLVSGFAVIFTGKLRKIRKGSLEEKAPILLISNAHSVTGTEEDKNKLIKRLESQNADLEKFEHIISHNLRSPLTNIIGLTQIIDRQSLNQQNKEVLDLLTQSTKNLDLIIKDLNHTVSIREMKNASYQPVSLSEVIESAEHELHEKISSSQAIISSNISKDDCIQCIPEFMDSILFNLLDNCLKFRHADRNPEINIQFEKTNDAYQFNISDNGIGIDMTENKDRLFKLYEKFDLSLSGRGVGLYMVYNKINVLKGHIHLESQVNTGTQVHFSIPRY